MRYVYLNALRVYRNGWIKLTSFECNDEKCEVT
jgi:hypothetical protein